MKVDTIWRGARLASMAAGAPATDAASLVAARAGRIVFAGAEADAPVMSAAETIDCEGRWITPGLIDCHTHLVHAGNRAAEFELRLKGASYEEIARAGGGIVSTMRQTRAASEEALKSREVRARLPSPAHLIVETALDRFGAVSATGEDVDPHGFVALHCARGKVAELAGWLLEQGAERVSVAALEQAFSARNALYEALEQRIGAAA